MKSSFMSEYERKDLYKLFTTFTDKSIGKILQVILNTYLLFLYYINKICTFKTFSKEKEEFANLQKRK